MRPRAPRLSIALRPTLLALTAVMLLVSPIVAQPAVPADSPWAVNFVRTTLYDGPSADATAVADLRPMTYLRIIGYEDVWANVYNPRTRTGGYVPSSALGPADAPPEFFNASAPPTLEEVNMPARVIRGAYAAFYPTPAEEATTYYLAHNASIWVKDSVEGEDGGRWYRTSEGDYLPDWAVRLPRPAPRTWEGRWIDADLNEPALLVAYEGDQPVMATLTIKGAGQYQTPTGIFSIQRRVASETMSSETIGIPRDGPGGYHLTNVLYTQYFLGSGESIHYNYWSSVWGYAGSHGCLGLPLEESTFFWNWATIGTPVSVHY